MSWVATSLHLSEVEKHTLLMTKTVRDPCFSQFHFVFGVPEAGQQEGTGNIGGEGEREGSRVEMGHTRGTKGRAAGPRTQAGSAQGLGGAWAVPAHLGGYRWPGGACPRKGPMELAEPCSMLSLRPENELESTLSPWGAYLFGKIVWFPPSSQAAQGSEGAGAWR